MLFCLCTRWGWYLRKCCLPDRGQFPCKQIVCVSKWAWSFDGSPQPLYPAGTSYLSLLSSPIHKNKSSISRLLINGFLLLPTQAPITPSLRVLFHMPFLLVSPSFVEIQQMEPTISLVLWVFFCDLFDDRCKEFLMIQHLSPFLPLRVLWDEDSLNNRWRCHRNHQCALMAASWPQSLLLPTSTSVLVLMFARLFNILNYYFFRILSASLHIDYLSKHEINVSIWFNYCKKKPVIDIL